MVDAVEVLFDPGQYIGVKRDPRDPEPVVARVEDFVPAARAAYPLWCVNPVLPGSKDLRAESVACAQTLVFESDTESVEDQLAYWMKRPHSLLVHSGGKSVHAYIRLVDPLEEAQYRGLHAAIRKAAGKVLELDKTTANPNRLCRVPGGTRIPGGERQEVLSVGRRYYLAELPAPLPYRPPPLPVRNRERLTGPTAVFLSTGRHGLQHTRNAFANLTNELAEMGLDFSEIMVQADKVPLEGRPSKEDERFMLHAYRRHTRRMREMQEALAFAEEMGSD